MSLNKTEGASGASLSNELLERDLFEIADEVIEDVYPNSNGLEKGYWGQKRIPNWGILRGAIATAVMKDRQRSNV